MEQPRMDILKQHGKATTETVDERLYAEKIRLISSQSHFASLASVINAALLAYILQTAVSPMRCGIWFGLLVILFLVRVVLFRDCARCESLSYEQARRVDRSITIFMLINGFVWGSASIFLFPPHSIMHQVFMVFVFGCLFAGAVSLYSVAIHTYLALTLPICIPAAIRHLVFAMQNHSPVSYGMVVMIIFGVSMLLITARRIKWSTLDTLKLSFENSDLVDILSREKQHAEELNGKLNAEINEHKNTEEALRKSEEHYRLLAENIRDLIWVLDLDLQYQYVSPSITHLRGFSMEEVLSQKLEEAMTPESFDLIVRTFADEFEADKVDAARSRTLELELTRKDGSTIWTETTATFMVSDDGQPYGILGVARDISERKQAERKLHKAMEVIKILSITDALTGSYNRGHLVEQLPREIRKARRYGKPLSLILCDIDNFKRVNDTYGHQAGDAVLKMFIECVNAEVRAKVDWVARYGGEEFVIVLPETNMEGATILAERLRVAVAEHTLQWCCKEISVTVSCGVTGFTPDTLEEKTSPHYMINRADELMYQAKESGRNRVTPGEL